MAILTEGRLLITDASNVPINGGKARVYNTGGTTLSTLYSDAALTVPLTNPVVANSSGFTPVIFGAEGLTVDITYLTAADATVTGRTYTAVPLVGADNGLFSRTLADNTRVKITGAGGIVLFQVGDASPDDVGGNLTIEGWAGTQGTLATLDFATVNTTGALTVGGKKLPGVVQTEATTFTAAANVDIQLVNTPTGVRGWEIIIFDLMASAGVAHWLRLSYDGGSTFKSGATDYGYGADGNVSTTPTSAAAVTAVQILPQVVSQGATANKPAMIKMTVMTPNSGSDATVIMGQIVLADTTGAGIPSTAIFAGYGLGNYGRATHLRLTNSGGATLTGKYRVVPIFGLGE